MSRCFPFPPPGYELKGRLDDVNLIIKEKHKSKKHKDKKEKKDKSARKEKGGGEDKHKEDKKRKREKHRDKKDKKNKDKRNSSGEKKTVGSLENLNGQKLVPDSERTVRIPDERNAVELGNRDSNDRPTSVQMARKITVMDKEKTNLMGRVQENDMLVIEDKGDHGRITNGHILQLASRRLENGRNFVGQNQTRVEEGKEKNGYRSIVGEGNGNKYEDQVKNEKAEDKKRKREKEKELKGFRKDKVEKETSNGNFLDFHYNIPSDLLNENNDCRGKLPKLKELNGFLHAKDSGVRRPNIVSRPAVASPHAAQTGNACRPSQNTINMGVGKRAVVTDQKPSGKLSSPQSVIDNVRNIGSSQTANSTKMENGRVNISNCAMSNGIISPHILRIERKTGPCQASNGVETAKPLINGSGGGRKAPSSHSPTETGGETSMQRQKESGVSCSASAASKRKEKVVITTKPPHPDLKYLSQILAVPELEQPPIENQEWLFGHEGSEKERAKLASLEIQSTTGVWSEAVHLNSADVIALPYVVPY